MVPALECDMAKFQKKLAESLSYNKLPSHPSRLFWDSEHQKTWWWPHFLAFARSKVLFSLHSFVKLDHSFRTMEITPKCCRNRRDSGFPFFWFHHLKSFSTSWASGTLPWGGGVWNRTGDFTVGDIWTGLVRLVMSFRIIVGMLCLSFDDSG